MGWITVRTLVMPTVALGTTERMSSRRKCMTWLLEMVANLLLVELS